MELTNFDSQGNFICAVCSTKIMTKGQWKKSPQQIPEGEVGVCSDCEIEIQAYTMGDADGTVH